MNPEQFLETAINATKSLMVELMGWEPVTCDYHQNEADEIHRQYQQLSKGQHPVQLVKGENGLFTIWERRPIADLWTPAVTEYLNPKPRTRTNK